MSTLSQDARGLIEGVASYLQKKKKTSQAVPKLRKLLTKVSEDASRDVTAVVHTAVPLTQDEEARMKNILTKISGRDIRITVRVDPDIIGGIRVQIHDWVVDMTFSQSLQTISAMLTE